MPKAISYVRFSSGTQTRGSSLDRQDSLISQWLQAHPDFSLSDLSQSDLGISGYSGKHLDHGLGKIIAAIGKKYISKGDYILVEAIDRVGRLPPTDMISLIHDIIGSGVTIVTLEDNYEYSKVSLNTNPSALYILIGKIQQAHDYSRNLSRRISAAYDSKRKKARQGEPIRIVTPFWLTTDGKLIPENAEFVRKCIELYLRGYGTRRILLELMNDDRFAATARPSTLKKWFTSKALIGVWSTKGEEISGVFEPLIDTQTYYRLQGELQRRRREMSPEQTYELSGLVECSQCSGRFYYRRKVHKDSVIIYSNCSTYLKRGVPHCSNNRTWPYEVLLAIFDATFSDTLADQAWDHSLGQLAEELDATKAELEEANHKKKKLIDLFMSTDNPNDADFQEAISEAQKNEAELGKRVALLKAEIEGKSQKALPNQPSVLTEKRMESANTHIETVTEDWLYLRDYLKKAGYKIFIDGDFASVSSTMGEIRFTVKKRSQMYGCYIVEVQHPEHEVFNEDTEEAVVEPPYNEYWAVDRKGVKCAEASRELLLNQLSEISDTHEYIVEFN